MCIVGASFVGAHRLSTTVYTQRVNEIEEEGDGRVMWRFVDLGIEDSVVHI